MSQKIISLVIPDETIINKIYFVRGMKVMLDSDLAEMYDVTTGNFNKAVQRNINRFPSTFLFRLTKKEYQSLRFQIGILKQGSHSKFLPNVFTEYGVLMAANVLKSKRAALMSVKIIEVFVKMREMLMTNKDILLKLEQIEKTVAGHDKDIEDIFTALKQLLIQPEKPRKKIGYKHFNE